MNWKLDEGTPLFIQIASSLEEDIFSGLYPEGTQIPSTTELSVELKMNPATVLKGMNLLVERNLIEKRRGLGMFVLPGAKEKIRDERKRNFRSSFVEPMLCEAAKLGIGTAELAKMIEEEGNNENRC